MFHIGYAFLMRNLGQMVANTVANQVSWASIEAYNSGFKHIHNLKTFEVPVGCFNIQGLSTEEQEQLRGMGLVQDIQHPYIFRGSPGSTHIGSIYKHDPQQGRFEPGTVGPQGYLAYISAIRGLHVFTEASTIASGHSASNVYTEVGPDTVLKPTVGKVSMRRSNWSKVDVDVDAKKIIPLENVNAFVTGRSGFGDNYGRFTTLRSPSLPIDSPGVLFPYFHGMVLPDKDITFAVFERLFHNAIGKDAQDSARMLGYLRDGFRGLAGSRSGRALSHAYKGIQIAQESQAVMTVLLQDGIYHGFVIQATQMSPFQLYGREHKSISRDELLKEISSVDTRARTLAEILAVINSPLNEDAMPIYLFTADQINTSRRLSNVLFRLDHSVFTNPDWKSQLLTLVSDLTFGDRFAAPTEANILRFLEFVETGEMSLLDNMPSFLGLHVLDQDRLSFGLRVFGPTAPSINVGGEKDRAFSIPVALHADDPNLSIDPTGKRHLQYLPFRSVPLALAVTQWRAVFNRGVIRIPLGRKNKAEFTNQSQMVVSISTDPGFTTAYNRIKAVARTNKEAVKSGKRKKDGNEVFEGAGPSNKKAKTVGLDF